LIEIFDGYWSRKIEEAADGRERAIVLQRLADVAHEQAGETNDGEPAVVPLYRCEDLIGGGTTVLNSLISEAVVVFLSPTTAGRSGVRFMYESFHEYVLARNLRDRHGANLRGVIDSYIGRAKGDRLLRGALVYILMWLDQKGDDVSEWVGRMYSRGFHSDAVTLAAKLRLTKATVAIVQRLRLQPLSRDNVLVLAHALAKHVHTARPDAFGDAVSSALYDPRLAVPATSVAIGLLEGSHAELPPGVQAIVFGFRWIWTVGVVAKESPNEETRELLTCERRARRVVEIGQYLSGKCRPVTWDWALELEFLAEASPIASAIALLIRRVALEFLIGPEEDFDVPLDATSALGWMKDVHRTSARSDRRQWWKSAQEAVIQYISSRGAAKSSRHLVVLDLLGDDESLSRHLSNGSDIAALPVARLLRLLSRCRRVPAMISVNESPETTHVVLATILNALVELGILLRSERQSDTALLWLEDMRDACFDTMVRDLTAHDQRAQGVRYALREIWREIISIGGELACDVLSRTARPRLKVH